MSLAPPLEFLCSSKSHTTTRSESIDTLVIAGWTGRNVEALEHHIRELEAMGVARPKSTPIFYRVSAALLSTAPRIDVIGGDSSGEVEAVIVSLEDGLWLGIGSDHTDRKAETLGVTLSKQMCAKPLSRELWRFHEIEDHFDRLVSRAWIMENGRRVLYQEGALAAMRPPAELMKLYAAQGGELPPGSAMFCGTHAAKGGIRPSSSFEIELEDPVLGRRLSHRYDIRSLPVEG